MVKPYLPDIIEACSSRVNQAFSTRDVDPFQVFFDKGILPQVKRSVYLNGSFPLVWMVYKFNESFGGNFAITGEVSFQLIIVMPTETGYTQQQREDINFKPRLIPIFDQVMKEIRREKWFAVVGDNGIKHTRNILPYWGMGDIKGIDHSNLFKDKFIDAISVNINGLKLRRENCTTASYPVLNTSIYPVSSTALTFFDDLELIVDGGLTTDPVAGASAVVIPFLVGKTYGVEQRGFGPLRQRRSVEFIPDLENGGFALTDHLFTHGDTYFVKIRPMYLV